MRSLLVCISTFIAFTPPTFAALGTDAGTALSFYRSRHSQFPSGQASRTELQNRFLQSEVEFAYQVLWDQRTFTLDSNQILRDIQTARFVDTKTSCDLLSDSRNNATILKSLPAKTTLEILDTDFYWAHVREKKSSLQGWVPLQQLKSKHEDTGVYVSLLETFVRKSPQSSASALGKLPRLYRALPLAIEKGFLKIQYQNQVGYVDINNFVSRADFANLAYSVQTSWTPISHRNGEFLVTKAGLQIPLKEVLGYVTNTHRGVIVSVTNPNGPQLRSRVEIVKPEAHVWALSKLEGHGEVWWKKSNLLIEDDVKSTTQISTDELMKREIYSIAFENKDSLRGIVSSEGVYRTEDGLTWTQIPQFGKQNYPVNIHPNGTWFVGSYKSSNSGKSFDPFIRWDLIAQAIESSLHRNTKILRLTQIDTLPNSQVQIHVDTGTSKVKLRSSLQGVSWQVIKN